MNETVGAVTRSHGTVFFKRRSLNSTRIMLLLILFAISSDGCRRPVSEPVTLNYLRLGWAQPDEFPTAESFSAQFMRDKGIRLRNFPVPEATFDQLEVTRHLLQKGGSGPDVVNIDFIWSGVLEKDLIDLQPYLATELSALEPQLLPGYTVGGRLIAIPYQVQMGVLEYRSDLLREYGYDHPPRTWQELESMAMRIQAGERRKGRKNFWGYVWQGAEAEALTCNALEWQASEGGGHIIENDRTISVNNPAAIRAWQRAARWIGRISSPSVIAFRETDSINAFDVGDAAFNRMWEGTTITRNGQYRQVHWQRSLAAGNVGYTSMPGGVSGVAGTLGGSGLAVSRYSAHQTEAIELVRYLTKAEIGAMKAKERDIYHRQPDDPELPQSASELVLRPSSVAGQRYEQVSMAYIRTVHSVLTGKQRAPQAAAELERQLVAITGFKTGPPK